MKSCTMICDLQFGSTGKGLIAGYLAKRDMPDTIVTAWMPNAGHTFVDIDNRKYVHTMLANGIVSPNARKVMIAPGSALNLTNLVKEIKSCMGFFTENDIRLIIHQNAVVVCDRHIAAESGSMTAIGSTKKGCGAALADKISRQPHAPCTIGQVAGNYDVRRHLSELTGLGVEVRIVDTERWIVELAQAGHVQIEGAQGFSLGINSGFYPYCTSRECTPAQIASDCLVSIRDIDTIVGCMRTYPIRVANRYNEEGEMVGYSGPGYPDQQETSFEEIQQKTEYTTVTKLPRRIFEFSTKQTEQAVAICRPDEIFLNFINYCTPQETVNIINEVNDIADRSVVRYLGHGPRVDEVDDISERTVSAAEL